MFCYSNISNSCISEVFIIIQWIIQIWLEYSVNFNTPSQDFLQLLSDITKNNYIHNDIVLCTALNMIRFMAAEIKSVCFCNILLFRCVVTSVQHADNMYISMCSLSICIYNIILHIFPSNKWRVDSTYIEEKEHGRIREYDATQTQWT